MTTLQAKSLDESTWPDFARLVEINNGVWGGCWCMWYHGVSRNTPPEQKRAEKERLVRESRAHACLVLDGDECLGWCQYGSPDELPRIHNARAYHDNNPVLPDWRITCFFVGKGHRGKGVAAVALKGAIEQIEALGGGRVEAYPEDTTDRKVAAAFLFNGSLSMFEEAGFERSRKIGKHKWVVTKTI